MLVLRAQPPFAWRAVEQSYSKRGNYEQEQGRFTFQFTADHAEVNTSKLGNLNVLSFRWHCTATFGRVITSLEKLLAFEFLCLKFN